MGRSWSQGGAYHVDLVEPLIVKAGAVREIYDSVKEEAKIVPADMASSKQQACQFLDATMSLVCVCKFSWVTTFSCIAVR